MARRSFPTADALIVVSTGGYFDVYPPLARPPNDRPAYRGVLSELGPTVSHMAGQLSVRPESVALDAAVSVWSRQHGAAAVRGDMGLGRNSTADLPAPKAGSPKVAAPKPDSKPAMDAAKGGPE